MPGLRSGAGRALVALGLLLGPAVPAAAQGQPGPCAPVAFENAGYTVCTVDLRRYRLGLFWRGPDGEPYGSLGRLAASEAGRRLAFAMNAGMYHPDRSPVGLYVEGGREMKRANTADGPGNFHMKPNGVFFAAGDRVGLLETRAYLRQKPRVDLATQSGPMLVIRGALHPKISEEGASRKLRNGVGVRDAHTAVFAISDGPVSFGAFARLFRDRLGCADALFLDGSVSSLHAPGLGRSDALWPVGPIVGAVEREPARPARAR